MAMGISLFKFLDKKGKVEGRLGAPKRSRSTKYK